MLENHRYDYSTVVWGNYPITVQEAILRKLHSAVHPISCYKTGYNKNGEGEAKGKQSATAIWWSCLDGKVRETRSAD